MAKRPTAPAKPEPRTITVGVRFTPTAYRAIAALAAAEHRAISQWIELAALAELERRKGKKP